MSGSHVNMTYSVCIDWDNDGSFATTGDDISRYVRSVTIKGGIEDVLQKRVSDVGTCTIILNNDASTTDRRFSPLNSTSPYYGKMIPNLPVRVQISDGLITWTKFRGYTRHFTVNGGWEGKHLASDGTIECVDELAHIQDESINLPIQSSVTANTLVRHVINQALKAPTATNSITFSAQPANNDTVLIGDGTTTYTLTWKTTLSGGANEVKIGTTLIDSASNLEAAINRASGSGTTYAGSITLPLIVSAARNRNTAYDTTNQDSDVLLRFNTSTKDKLAQGFLISTDVAYINQVRLYLKKVGTPTGTLTARIETDSTTGPSGTLVDANAVITVAESSLSTSYGLITFTFPGEVFIPINTKLWIVLSTDRAASGTNYVAWGADASSPSYTDGEMYSEASAVWGAESKDACFDLGANVLSLTAAIRGTVGNAYTLAKTGSWCTLGGATFSGGANYPTALTPVLATGKQTFDYACDNWTSDKTNGTAALEEVVDSEHGLLWIAQSGEVTLMNRDFLFLLPSDSADLTLNSEQNNLEGALATEDTFNRVEVEYTPLTQISNGVIAQAKSVITVPGQTGLTERYNPTQSIRVSAGDTLVKLPFTDTVGNPIGALSLTLPLVPTTDFTVNEDASGTSVDYTNSARVAFSVAVNGSNAEVSIKNTALGPLFVTMLKIRGVGLVRYNPSTAIAERDIAPGEYRRSMSLSLPIASGATFPQALADYYLDRYSEPTFRVRSITFREFNKIGTKNLFSFTYGDVIELTDYQSAVSAQKYFISGISYDNVGPKTTGAITFNVFRVDDSVYGQWDSTDPSLGDWDTARWSI